MEKITNTEDKMSRGEFKVFFSDLYDHYDEFQSNILEFLESEGVTDEVVVSINPLDIVLEIDELNRAGEVFQEIGGIKSMSNKLIILCGLSELIASKYGKRDFSEGDILIETRSGIAYVVSSIDYNGYFLTNTAKNTSVYVNNETAKKFKKIGKGGV